MSKIWSQVLVLLTAIGSQFAPLAAPEQKVEKGSKHNIDGSRKTQEQKKREKKNKVKKNKVRGRPVESRTAPASVADAPKRPAARLVQQPRAAKAVVVASLPAPRVVAEAPRQPLVVAKPSKGVKAKSNVPVAAQLEADKLKSLMRDKLNQVLSNRDEDGAQYNPALNLRKLINDDSKNAGLIKSVLKDVIAHSTPKNRAAAQKLLPVVDKQIAVMGETQSKSVADRLASLEARLKRDPLFMDPTVSGAPLAPSKSQAVLASHIEPEVGSLFHESAFGTSEEPRLVKKIHRPTGGVVEFDESEIAEIKLEDTSRGSSRSAASTNKVARLTIWAEHADTPLVSAPPAQEALRSSLSGRSSVLAFSDKVTKLEADIDAIAMATKAASPIPLVFKQKVFQEFTQVLEDYIGVKCASAKGKELNPDERGAEQALQKMIGEANLDEMVKSNARPQGAELDDLFGNTYLVKGDLRPPSHLQASHSSSVREATSAHSPKTPPQNKVTSGLRRFFGR